MASPDATPYIDLVLRDMDPQDIVDVAVQDLQTSIPEWVPREGNIEMLVYEGMSVQIAELIFALNRVPSSVVQVFLKLNGIEYDQGEAPTTTLKFTTNSAGVTIPAGTSALLKLDNDQEPVVFTIGAEVTAGAGLTTVSIPATGNRFTSEANGYTTGTVLELLDSLIYVETVELASPVTGGRDEEDDLTYFERGTQRFSRQTNTLLLPRQFESSMLEEVYVERSLALDNYNPETDAGGDGPVGSDGGHITLAGYGNNEALTVDEKAVLLAKMSDLAAGNLAIHIIDPVITNVDVTTSIYIEDGYDATDVATNVEDALKEYLDPMTWEWKTKVRRNDIISIITNVVGVDYMETLTVPAADQILTSVAPLAKANVVSVTVLTDA